MFIKTKIYLSLYIFTNWNYLIRYQTDSLTKHSVMIRKHQRTNVKYTWYKMQMKLRKVYTSRQYWTISFSRYEWSIIYWFRIIQDFWKSCVIQVLLYDMISCVYNTAGVNNWVIWSICVDVALIQSHSDHQRYLNVNFKLQKQGTFW